LLTLCEKIAEIWLINSGCSPIIARAQHQWKKSEGFLLSQQKYYVSEEIGIDDSAPFQTLLEE
jgi:hypothetical protein